jgi:hypothetical protein
MKQWGQKTHTVEGKIFTDWIQFLEIVCGILIFEILSRGQVLLT